MVKALKRAKTKIVNFKLTEEQYEVLQRIADARADGNMSSLIRRWIRGAELQLATELPQVGAGESRAAAG